MKFGLIATVIDAQELTGVEKYALSFIEHVPADIRNEVVVFCHPAGASMVKQTAPDMSVRVSPFRNRILTDQLWLPFAIRRSGVQFIYNMSLSHPWVGFGRSPFAMMIHDATPWRYPETTSNGMRYYYLPQIQRALRSEKLQGVITNSNSSSQDISQWCGIDDKHIHPIHLGIDGQNFSSKRHLELFHGLPDGCNVYILTVGTMEPRKNLNMLFRAFERIAEVNPDLYLVIVGRKGWQKSLTIPESITQRIIFTGYVQDEQLSSLYAHAQLFVFPSFYEGFGFPLVEAMASGVPVLAADTSSLPEVGGDACWYANPHADTEFAEKMQTLLTNRQTREELTRKGLYRAERFTWDQTGQQTWSVLLGLSRR